MTIKNAALEITVNSSGKVVKINAEPFETRIHDLELAVLELARVVERLVVGSKHWKGEERQLMLTAVDNARALATPDDDDDPEPEPATAFGMPIIECEDVPPGVAVVAPAGDTTSRYWIDLRNGEGYGTDDLGDVRREVELGRTRNVLDRKTSEFLVLQRTIKSEDAWPESWPDVRLMVTAVDEAA